MNKIDHAIYTRVGSSWVYSAQRLLEGTPSRGDRITIDNKSYVVHQVAWPYGAPTLFLRRPLIKRII